MTTKTCRWCKVEKPKEQFNRHPAMPDGHINKCKACASAYNKLKYLERSEEIRSRTAQYHKDNRDAILEKRRQDYRDNKEKYKEQAKRRTSLPGYREYNKTKCRERYYKNKAKHLSDVKMYRSSERGREVVRRSLAKQKQINPHKIKARYFVSNAVRDGRLIRPDSCSDCGKTCKPQAHHHAGYDSENWLKVQWLCKECHKKADLNDCTRPLENNVAPTP